MLERLQLADTMLVLPSGDTRGLADPLLRRFGPRESGDVPTVDDLVAEMDRNDVSFAVIGGSPVDYASYRRGPYTVGTGVTDDVFDETCATIANAIGRYPSRFTGFVFLDPSDCMAATRRLDRAVSKYGIRIAHVMPATVGLPPNHPTYFPLYAKCVDLGIAIRINIGMPGPSRRADLQRPIFLDEVLLTFPELTLVGAHLGHPWLEETIALMRKYTNFYLMTSGWAPSRIPSEVWEFANTSRGAEKVMWASDYPLLSITRCASEALELPLGESQKRRYLHDNAVELFHLGH